MAHERAEAVMRGLVPHWVRNIKAARRPINARSEGIEVKPMFRDLLRTKRCIVPASGFF
ncbi:SOS response-associated peptidase family protein [Methanoregula sp.]|uniref:SOS response-associated peptidase family protein n=1 Tax=Methanoregula sp. TaxID=2052170 RepID=UPI003561CC0D